MRQAIPKEHVGRPGLDVPILVTLRHNASGQERTVEAWHYWHTDGDPEDAALFTAERSAAYWWVEGNGSCDCNRASYFDDWNEGCGDERFTLVRLVREDTGEVLAADDWYTDPSR